MSEFKVLYNDVFNGNLHAEEVAYFEELLPEQVTLVKDENSADYDLFIGGRPTAEVLQKSLNLRFCLIPFAGIPDAYYELEKQGVLNNISIHNCHYHRELVSEYAVGLMFGIAKDLGRKDRNLRIGNWLARFENSRALVLRGKTALVMGYGAIGSEIGRICQSLGMRVLGTRRNLASVQEVDGAKVYPTADLHALLSQTDVLFNALPLTTETTNLIAAEELKLLKTSSIIVNIGRAKTFNEKALFEALQNGQIRGAAFDVWYTYPADTLARTGTFPGNYPFHQLDNMLMSPHSSASLADREDIYYRLNALAKMLTTLVESGELPNQVDLKLGY